jgi:hypothetical protein
MKALQSFEVLAATYPVTQHHIPEDLNFHAVVTKYTL